MVAMLTREDDVSARAQAVGGTLVLMLLPVVLLAPLAGLLAARVDRRLMLMVADVLRLVIVVTVPLVGVLAWTLAAAFLVSCLSLLWVAAARASWPRCSRRRSRRAPPAPRPA